MFDYFIVFDIKAEKNHVFKILLLKKIVLYFLDLKKTYEWQKKPLLVNQELNKKRNEKFEKIDEFRLKTLKLIRQKEIVNSKEAIPFF